jgi:hypothetical protein
MRRLVPLLSLLVLAGCPSGDDSQDDVDDDDISDAGVDGGGDVTGVVLGWEARPGIPATVDDDIVVSSMRFGVTNLRLVGDAGTVAFDRSELAWSAGTTPETDMTESAPAGLYSSLELMIAAPAATFAFEIQGTYQGLPFVLHDSTALPVAIGFGSGLNLVAGGGLTIQVRVDVDDLVEDLVPAIPLENGMREIGPGDPQLADLRAAVADAFEVSDD